MFTRSILFVCAFLATQAFAGTPAMIATSPAVVAPEADPFFTGSFTAMYATNYSGRGLIVSNTAMGGADGVEVLALKLQHTFADSKWSYKPMIAYTITNSGHELYGNPTLPGGYVYSANLENELAIINEMRYSEEKWSLGFGHEFVHGGLLGAMAKHFANQGASVVNELFLSPTYEPFAWLSLECPIRYSFDGVKGWWFEPSVTFKAPLIGTAENIKMAALISFNISLTADYFKNYHGACQNGTQAFWIKLATPYFVNEAKTWIITPSVSFNWAGKGSIKANENAEIPHIFGDTCSDYVPFKNFGVIGGVSCTYIF